LPPELPNQFISSRKPDDLPAFNRTLIEALERGEERLPAAS
jgi:hypothetical protein